MNLITLEIKSTNLTENKKLIKRIYKQLPKYLYFHFFYEPELIIRTEQQALAYIKPYLKRRKLKYKTYAYPYGKGFGEDSKSVMIKYQPYFLPLLNLNSELAVVRQPKHTMAIIERYTHTFINQMGYEWLDETRIHLKLARGRVGVIREYEVESVGARLYCSFVMFCIRRVALMLKGLDT